MKPDRPHPAGWERCLPSERRCKPAGEWNHYRVDCNDGVLKLSVNGKEVSGGSECRPRKGYLCLESEGSECHFRNIRIKELPSTDPPAGEKWRRWTKASCRSTPASTWPAGRRSRATRGTGGRRTGFSIYDGKSEAKDKNLWSEKEYGDFVLICDWRWTAKPTKQMRPVILPTGEQAVDADGKPPRSRCSTRATAASTCAAAARAR